MFQTQPWETTASSQAAGSRARSSSSSLSRSTNTQPALSIQPSGKPLSLGDLHAVALDIKNSITVAISDLRLYIQAVATWLEEVEETTTHHDAAIHKVHQITDAHTLHLHELQHHVEDLDNRGHHHNIRVKGLPEAVEPRQLTQANLTIFNVLLERAPEMPINMIHLHQATRQRGRDTDPPRDVVCCIVNFHLKEEILRRARIRGRILFHGADIKLYQDLSYITLQHQKNFVHCWTCCIKKANFTNGSFRSAYWVWQATQHT